MYLIPVSAVILTRNKSIQDAKEVRLYAQRSIIITADVDEYLYTLPVEYVKPIEIV